jgi:hypothetical protein
MTAWALDDLSSSVVNTGIEAVREIKLFIRLSRHQISAQIQNVLNKRDAN